MITIEYCEDGEAVSDFNVDRWFKSVVNATKDPFESAYRPNDKVSTTPPIDRVRVAIANGELSCEDVNFIFNGKIIKSNEYGALSEWPDGFCDVGLKLIEKILTGREKYIERNIKSKKTIRKPNYD